MTRTPSDACFFVGVMSAATAAGAWLYNEPTWFLAALIVTLIATVAWAITHHHETQPIPYTTTIRYDIDQLFRQQRAEWDRRTTCTHDLCIEGRDINIINADHIMVDQQQIQPTMTPHQADTNWPDQHHLPVWPTDAGAPE